MSASPKLPDRASIEYLRKESKALLRAFAAGDASTVARIRQHLPRAGRLADADIPSMDLSLQEVQHALACEYGFRTWEDMLAAVNGPRLEDLSRLSRRDAQVLLREADQHDIPRVLAQAPAPVRERFLNCASARVREFLSTEIGFLKDQDTAAMAAARERFMGELYELIDRGQATWPPADEAPPTAAATDPRPDPHLRHMHRPLHELTEQELAATLHAMADLALREGVLALEPIAGAALPSLLTEGITLIADGTEPDLVEDLLATRAATILRNRTIRGHMVIEGWISIHNGDNPGMVRHKVETYFIEESSLVPVEGREPGLAEMVARLQAKPLAQMSHPEVAELHCDMSFVARLQGQAALMSLLVAVDDEVLAAGMHQSLVEGGSRDATLTAMTDRLQELRLAWHRRHWMAIGGILAIQVARSPEQTVAAAQAAAAEQAARLVAAWPSRPLD